VSKALVARIIFFIFAVTPTELFSTPPTTFLAKLHRVADTALFNNPLQGIVVQQSDRTIVTVHQPVRSDCGGGQSSTIVTFLLPVPASAKILDVKRMPQTQGTHLFRSLDMYSAPGLTAIEGSSAQPIGFRQLSRAKIKDYASRATIKFNQLNYKRKLKPIAMPKSVTCSACILDLFERGSTTFMRVGGHNGNSVVQFFERNGYTIDEIGRRAILHYIANGMAIIAVKPRENGGSIAFDFASTPMQVSYSGTAVSMPVSVLLTPSPSYARHIASKALCEQRSPDSFLYILSQTPVTRINTPITVHQFAMDQPLHDDTRAAELHYSASNRSWLPRRTLQTFHQVYRDGVKHLMSRQRYRGFLLEYLGRIQLFNRLDNIRTELSLDDLRLANLRWLPEKIPELPSVAHRRWPGTKLTFPDQAKTDFNKVLLKQPVFLTRLHARFRSRSIPGQIAITYSDPGLSTSSSLSERLPKRSSMSFAVHRLPSTAISTDRANTTVLHPTGDALQDHCSKAYWRIFTPFLDQRAAHNLAAFTGIKAKSALTIAQPVAECAIPEHPDLSGL